MANQGGFEVQEPRWLDILAISARDTRDIHCESPAAKARQAAGPPNDAR